MSDFFLLRPYDNQLGSLLETDNDNETMPKFANNKRSKIFALLL